LGCRLTKPQQRAWLKVRGRRCCIHHRKPSGRLVPKRVWSDNATAPKVCARDEHRFAHHFVAPGRRRGWRWPLGQGPCRRGRGHGVDREDLNHLNLIRSRKTGSFGVRVFRRTLPWLGGAKDHEGIQILRRAEGVHSEAGSGRGSCCGHLSPGRDQPGDLLQLEEEE